MNDIITLLRNPDQLLAFVDLAKAIFERPTILPTLIEAFVGTFQRFQNVQNPFPGPQNLLNPTNPSTFTNDNSTFGRTWFGGYALAFVTLGIASGGASAAALTALEGFSATLANTIRFVISAPSLLASRAAGLVGRTALRVAVRVGRATELRVSAVKRAVSGLPTPRLQRVSTSIRRLDDDLEDAITAGCGGGFTLAGGDCFDEELVDFVADAPTARRAAVNVLNRLGPERAVRLLDADDAIHDPLVAAVGRSDAVDAETVSGVVAVADELDARRTAALADFLDQDGAARLVGDDGVDATTMRRILDEDAGDVGVDLHDELGVSGRRIDELVEEGLDLRKHESGLRICVESGKSVTKDGDIAEIIGHSRIVRRARNGIERFDESKSYIAHPKGQGKGIDIFDENGWNIGEFDHVVTTQDGDVVAVYQTKLPADEHGLANSQNTQLLRLIDRNGIDSSRSGFHFDESQFEGEIDSVTVGPNDGAYNLELNYDERQLEAILDTIREEGI